MEYLFKLFKEENNIDIISIVDITSLTFEENRGYPNAILLLKALPRNYIDAINTKSEPDYDTFINFEKNTDELADTLAAIITQKGYNAISQSENSITIRNEYDDQTKSTVLPHKKIAILSGVGWIGKNNLLVTDEYGSAVSMCSVLTDMPLIPTGNELTNTNKCGNCNLCVNICPKQALHGTTWTAEKNRDEIIDIQKCTACLKCLAGCRYSISYSKSKVI